METLPISVPGLKDVTFLKIAREIAMDINPLEKILETHGVSQEEWLRIQDNMQFQEYLRGSIQEWNSAVNTSERVKLKSMAFVEEALPEFYARAHDPKEALPAKVEVLKTVARLAGFGNNVDGSVSGERLSVTINLGSDQQVKIEKNLNPQYIEGDTL